MLFVLILSRWIGIGPAAMLGLCVSVVSALIIEKKKGDDKKC